MTRARCLCLLAGLAWALSAHTAFACFEKLTVDRGVVADALLGDTMWHPGSNSAPPFVAAHLSYLRDAAIEEGAAHGAVVFVRDGAGWRASIPVAGESAVGVFAADWAVFVVTQLQVEGPGQSFTIARSSDGLRTGTCVTLPFPKLLNSPSWAMETLQLEQFAMGRNGHGELLASAEIDLETSSPRQTYWRYRTRDGGITWSRPHQLKRLPPPSASAVAMLQEPAPSPVVEELTQFARAQ